MAISQSLSSASSEHAITADGYGWAGAMPEKQGLYDPANERDACGVGFIINIKGTPSHSILRDSEDLLCNMSHRGATGADERDGDGAGVMASMPHRFLAKEFAKLSCTLPAAGHYATGNLFFHRDAQVRQESMDTFDQIAQQLGLRTVAWRLVPTNSQLLGPMGQSKEPVIMQPLVVPAEEQQAEEADFARRLFVLRKRARHEIGFKRWFYICSLATRNIVYKGLLTPAQVPEYYEDLRDEDFETHFALVHSRFSTNTFPSWERAQPFNWCAHNDRVSKAFGKDLQQAFPIIDEFGSDSAAFDSVLELLVVSGVMTMPEAVMVMVPEAWQNNPLMPADKRAFYEWASCIMEPWDGPALFTFSDGRYCGASLDRNGLRPCRFYITSDDRMICASEVGTVKVDPKTIVQKGRLMPGRMLLVDTKAGEVVDDEQLKLRFAREHPYQEWLDKHQIKLEHLAPSTAPLPVDETPVSHDRRFRVFGYSAEQFNLILGPMVLNGKEPLGSMGNDTVLACLDPGPRLPYEYFRELFAQVTNPPIDPIREKIVMSLRCHVGPEGNLLEVSEHQAHRLSLDSPVLTNGELAAIRDMSSKYPSWISRTIDISYDVSEGIAGYAVALDRVCEEAQQAIANGAKVIILSDRNIGPQRVALSALLASGAVHHHLVAAKLRAKVALLVETGEARETHHFCVLVGYGVDAVCPYVVYEAVVKLHRENVLAGKPVSELIEQYREAIDDGFRKVMSKMGISTMQSYKGAQIFEALGISSQVINKCFVGTASRVEGTTLEGFAADALARHDAAYAHQSVDAAVAAINDEGEYNWRKGGEKHINTPGSIASLQDAVRTKNKASWKKYTDASTDSIRDTTIRGLLDVVSDESHAIPIEEVEPWTNIVKRFCTGAMSYGSISKEAHTALAVAMNRLGGKSNSGEGGEDPQRSVPRENGDSERSAIKQVASGRFGLVESLQTGKPAELSTDICNTDRAFGTILSYHLSTSHGLDGLPKGTIRLHLKGSAGQSLGAFLAPGIAIDLEGDANDYVGKGLSGGQIVVYPPKDSSFAPENNIIVGNVCLFGATSGEAFFNGIAAERFAVRNSGALAVVEGVGDHGCEYMTGGRVIVLGNVGRNFAAGMSGGIAYVLADNFRSMCNTQSVDLETVHGDEAVWLKSTIQRHADLTGSQKAREVIKRFADLLPKFVKVFPTDYKRVLQEQEEEAKRAAESAKRELSESSGSDSEKADSGDAKVPKVAANGSDLVDIEDALVDDSLLSERFKKLDKLRGFVKYKRRGDKYRNAKKRVSDWDEISSRQSKSQLQVQASRCIDCGVPFCQSDVDGCPIGNVIPKWNELVFKDQWREAFNRLMATNNFPEFTGRVCPAPCEGACVAGISELPVAIKSIEAAIIDHAWEMGWMKPAPPARRTGKTVAIVGSGPAGLSAADQLNTAGYTVTVYEREDRIGGLLTYGIPNMKLDKKLVERRVDKLRMEGVRFVTNAHVGVTHSAQDLHSSHDALLLATGATWPRDLPIDGRQLNGIHFAMEYLTGNTKTLLDTASKKPLSIDAKGKRVVVIGGGDTGNDCIGTAVRHGAASVVNFELLPQPPKQRAADNPWPQYPRVYRIDYGHEEVISRWGKDPREYCISAKRFV
ncbi:glutamate synthase [NADH], partial [Dipsacomyces acuminosporus]